MLRSLAILLSRVFDPVILIPGTIVLVVSLALVNGYPWWFLVMLLAIDAGIPGAYVIWRYISNGRRDWDIRDRKDRRIVYGITIVAHFLGLVFVYLNQVEALALLLLYLWLMAIVFGVITWFWKISVHAGVITTLAILLSYFLGERAWWVWAIPPAVAWSRVYLGQHTLMQVVAGLGVPLVILGPLLFFFG